MNSRRHFRRHTGTDESPKEGLWIAIICVLILVVVGCLVRPTPFG